MYLKSAKVSILACSSCGAGEFAFVYAAGPGRIMNQPPTGWVPASALLAAVVAGVYQVNFRVPANAPSGLQDLVIAESKASSPAVKVIGQ